MELSGGSEGAAPLAPSDDNAIPMIRSKPSLSTRLETVLTTVLSSLNRMSGSLNDVFDADNRAALKATLADTATLTHALAAQQGAISAAIKDASLTAHNAAQASQRLAPAGDQLGPMIDRLTAAASEVESMAKTAAQASASAGRTAESASSGLQQLRSESLPDLQRSLAELDGLVSSLRRLTEQTENNPNSLLLGTPPRRAGPGEKAAK